MRLKEHTKNSVDAAIIFGVVCDLGVFPKHYFSTSRDHAQFRNVDLDDSSLRHDAKLRVHGRLGIFLDTEDLQLERSFQVSYTALPSACPQNRVNVKGRTMRNICFFIPQCHRSDEPFHLHRFSRKALTHECSLGHHPLPCLAFALSRLHHLEHLVFRNSPNFWQRHRILRSLVFPLLLDRTRHCLCILLPFTIEEICRQSTVWNCRRVSLLDISLVVCLECFLELDFLSMSSRVQQLRLDTEGFLCECGACMDCSSLALAPGVSSMRIMKKRERSLIPTFAQNDLTVDHGV
jgi:hypothetical protein